MRSDGSGRKLGIDITDPGNNLEQRFLGAGAIFAEGRSEMEMEVIGATGEEARLRKTSTTTNILGSTIHTRLGGHSKS